MTLKRDGLGVMMRKGLCALRLASALLLIVPALPALAADDVLRFVQDSPNGAIVAVVNGAVAPCAGSPIFPLGAPSVGRLGNEFAIVSPFVILDPPVCPSPAQPYEVRADLGIVPDGRYTAVWTAESLQARAAFAVDGGVLQASVAPTVPALDPSALSALMACLALFGAVARRRVAA